MSDDRSYRIVLEGVDALDKVHITIHLKDFFSSHSRGRVRRFFTEVAGYDPVVAGLLADLCTAPKRVDAVNTASETGEARPPRRATASTTSRVSSCICEARSPPSRRSTRRRRPTLKSSG